jgi:tRNA(Ile)-lysidine synthase
MRPAASDAAALLGRCAFPDAGTAVDLAVSGGPDSCGLALLAREAGLDATLHHVDHGLRGCGDLEAELVASLARRLGASFASHAVVVATGPNLEARARDARRGVLPTGSLTGHTMDDQAETVLLNLLRGSGLDGLAGMSTSTKPLLGLRRAELHAFVDAAGVRVVADRSNYDLSMRRNLLRARVLPELNRVAGRDLVPVLARQASLARVDTEFLDAAAQSAVPDPTDVAALLAAPLALRRRRLRDLARGAARDGAHPPSASEVDRIDAVVRGEAVATELAGGRRVARRAGRLRLDEG